VPNATQRNLLLLAPVLPAVLATSRFGLLVPDADDI